MTYDLALENTSKGKDSKIPLKNGSSHFQGDCLELGWYLKRSQFNFNYFIITAHTYVSTDMTKKTMLRLPEMKFSFKYY